jgi:hypothetical protein
VWGSPQARKTYFHHDGLHHAPDSALGPDFMSQEPKPKIREGARDQAHLAGGWLGYLTKRSDKLCRQCRKGGEQDRTCTHPNLGHVETSVAANLHVPVRWHQSKLAERGRADQVISRQNEQTRAYGPAEKHGNRILLGV